MPTTSTKRPRAELRCTECGWTTPKWVGRCGECQAWGTIEEAGAAPARASVGALAPATPAASILDVDVETARARPTGVGELDRVLGGGLVPGAVVLLAGEPGVGKSTLLLDVAARAASAVEGRVLYVTGEESASQVRLRAERIGALHEDLLLTAETDLATVLGHIEAMDPALLVVDSVQTVADSAVDGSAGGVSQVRAVAATLIRAAKARAMPAMLVGHVTKDGSIAGPRVLEHLVDVVCQVEGERHSRLRLVRAVKNRFGATDEVGCFDLREDGIIGLPDPSGLFLSAAPEPVAGTCVTVTLEGRRPMPVEVQSLLTEPAGPPRRTVSGVDGARVAMMLAVLAARLEVGTAGKDVYVSTVGGARASEPAADLALGLALLSASLGRPVRPGVVAFGEVGLTGELRATTGVGRRLAEAARLGFTTAVVPSAGEAPANVAGIRVVRAANLAEAARECGLGPSGSGADR
ncbi:DNA repair protein RadA [Georgenia sp. Z1344]|uniref:DNA repair protein RadA n=1 Tax=Georgenia sp. Z1344 TaxID=3416706 RepID=UPI003CE9714E